MSKHIEKEIQNFSKSVVPSKRVLDVGCGLRPYEKYFKHCDYIGIDVEVSGREMDDKKPDKFYDRLNIPFEDKSFDIVICTEVLEHCVDTDKLLSEMYRILKISGILFLTVPFMWGEHEIPYDFRRYSSYGLKRKIESTKFKIIEQKKLVCGVKAIEYLVSSEINSYKNSTSYRPNLWYRVKEFLLYYLWLFILRLWNLTYHFDRVYIHNLVIAKKM